MNLGPIMLVERSLRNLRKLRNPFQNTFRNRKLPNIAESNLVVSLYAIKTCNNRLFRFFNQLFFWQF